MSLPMYHSKAVSHSAGLSGLSLDVAELLDI